MQSSVKSPLKRFCKHFNSYVVLSSFSIKIRDPVSCRAVGRTNLAEHSPASYSTSSIRSLTSALVHWGFVHTCSDVGLMHASEIAAESPLL